MFDTTLTERIVGCILGGAIGDALGGPFEGVRVPITFEPPDIWLVSDDTQLTLATCEAICHPGRFRMAESGGGSCHSNGGGVRRRYRYHRVHGRADRRCGRGLRGSSERTRSVPAGS